MQSVVGRSLRGPVKNPDIDLEESSKFADSESNDTDQMRGVLVSEPAKWHTTRLGGLIPFTGR